MRRKTIAEPSSLKEHLTYRSQQSLERPIHTPTIPSVSQLYPTIEVPGWEVVVKPQVSWDGSLLHHLLQGWLLRGPAWVQALIFYSASHISSVITLRNWTVTSTKLSTSAMEQHPTPGNFHFSFFEEKDPFDSDKGLLLASCSRDPRSSHTPRWTYSIQALISAVVGSCRRITAFRAFLPSKDVPSNPRVTIDVLTTGSRANQSLPLHRQSSILNGRMTLTRSVRIPSSCP